MRDTYEASMISQPPTDCADCQLESLWRRVKPESGPPFSVAAVYRPPRRAAAAIRADFGELEMQLQRVLVSHSGSVLILGDLNSNLLDATSGETDCWRYCNRLILNSL